MARLIIGENIQCKQNENGEVILLEELSTTSGESTFYYYSSGYIVICSVNGTITDIKRLQGILMNKWSDDHIKAAYTSGRENAIHKTGTCSSADTWFPYFVDDIDMMM